MSDDNYPYPEHEKLRASQTEVSVLSSFIEFIAEQRWELCAWDDENEFNPRPWPIHKQPDEIIGMFLGIDPKKLEIEKRAMLEAIRNVDKLTASPQTHD